MASFVKFNPFVEALAEKVHNLGSDQLTIALTNSAPSASNSVLTDITQISYTNCSSRNITTVSSTQTSGTYSLVTSDLTLTASGGTVGPFRYVVMYNDTSASDNLIGYYDYGSSITLNDTETFTVDFGATTLTLA
jgi:hypothetical protein